ncbi:hypothetical protein BKA62DRAFT_689698 [Auriculariales sp. MPI-PUGE-AT-0066]|nr:hypothetical protein BKA62DRAFT_689698 [Auriculariales sp. MPI-PUGE-AT-0066]
MPPKFIFTNEHGPSKASSARKIHTQRLFEILELCIQRGDMPRARRAWSLLSRCNGVNWKALWRLALLILNESNNSSTDSLDFLRAMKFQQPEQESHYFSDKEAILVEIVHTMIVQEDYRGALEELQLLDNPILHTYAGMLSLYLAQPSESTARHLQPQFSQQTVMAFSPSLMRDVDFHFNRALALDPDNIVASDMLLKVRGACGEIKNDESSDRDAENIEYVHDDEDSDENVRSPPKKRARV